MDNKNIKGQIHNAMYQNILQKGWVAPVDVLLTLEILPKGSYEDWRFGKVLFLEKACNVNLKKLSEVMHEMRAYAKKNNLKPSWTYYHQWGKNSKNKLRFSKSGDEKVEYNYATHFLDTKRIAELKQSTDIKIDE